MSSRPAPPFRIRFETAISAEELGAIVAEDHDSALAEALRRYGAACPDEPCDIVAADRAGREKRVALDPFGPEFPLALHAPDRYARKHEADTPIADRVADPEWAPGWER